VSGLVVPVAWNPSGWFGLQWRVHDRCILHDERGRSRIGSHADSRFRFSTRSESATRVTTVWTGLAAQSCMTDTRCRVHTPRASLVCLICASLPQRSSRPRPKREAERSTFRRRHTKGNTSKQASDRSVEGSFSQTTQVVCKRRNAGLDKLSSVLQAQSCGSYVQNRWAVGQWR